MPNFKVLTLSDTVPVPTGSDIKAVVNGASVAVVGGDLALRNTTARLLVVPYQAAGYRRIGLGLHAYAAYSHAVTVALYGSYDALGVIAGLLASVSFPASQTFNCTFGAYAPGQGGTTGGATVADAAHYIVAALQDPFPYIVVSLTAADAATTGKFKLGIARS